MTHRNRYFIEALSRGLRILEVFTPDKPTLSLAEIASAVNLDKSTVFRFVYTLEELGYLERDAQTKRYRPGLQILRLGFTALHSMDIIQLARPYLKALSMETNETVNMAVRDGEEAVNIARFGPAHIVNVALHIGARLPLYCTAMGKVLLATMPKETVAEVLGDGPYEALTEKTLTTIEELWNELDRVREQGYALSDEELALGLRSVAAAIRNSEGDIIASLEISGTSARLSREALDEQLSAQVVETANRISQALGQSR